MRDSEGTWFAIDREGSVTSFENLPECFPKTVLEYMDAEIAEVEYLDSQGEEDMSLPSIFVFEGYTLSLN